MRIVTMCYDRRSNISSSLKVALFVFKARRSFNGKKLKVEFQQEVSNNTPQKNFSIAFFAPFYLF